jgi:long-chain acyl-CoA synthetase
MAGAVVVQTNPLYVEREIEFQLADSGAETIISLDLFYPRIDAVKAKTPLKRIVLTNVRDYLPIPLKWLYPFKAKREGQWVDVVRTASVLDFVTLLKGASPDAPAVAVGPDDLALLQYTGGTTGTPKGVIAPHRGVVATGLQAHAWANPVLVDVEDVVMLPLPLFHAAAGVLGLSTFLVGRNPVLLVPNPRDIADVLATIKRERPAFIAGVPTLYNAILNHPDVQAGKVDFSSIKLCFCGAAPLLAETRRRFEALTGGRLMEAYSLTEALTALVGNPVRGQVKDGSVGMPLPDVEIRIVDPETGKNPLPTGEVGEILIRAPQLMPGYWQNAEESALALRDHGDGGVWLHTADLGYLDADGYLFVVDRLKDLIKPGGMQVWPREVEEVVAAHPAVAEVGVAGVPDPAKGEAVKAWVVLRAGATASVDELRSYCKEHLAPYKVPSQVEFRSELPKSMIGKVLRRVLVAEHRARLA